MWCQSLQCRLKSGHHVLLPRAVRLGYELCGGAAAHFWFSGWGIPEGEILAFERRIGAAMTRVFAT